MLIAFVCITAPIQAEPPPTPEQVIHAVTESEKRLKAVYVEGTSNIEESAPDPIAWNATPYRCDVHAYFTGQPDGPYRLKINTETSEWTDGPVGFPPVAEDAYDILYDGKQVTILHLRTGAAGRTADPRRARIINDPSLHHPTSRTATEAMFTPNHWRGTGKSLSAYLKAYHEPRFVVQNTTLANQPVVQLSARYKDLIEEHWWFDPAKSYAVVQYEYVLLPDRTVRFRLSVSGYDQISPGLWSPTRAEFVDFNRDRQGNIRRHVFSATRVVAHNEGLPEEALILNLPPQTRVGKDPE